VANRQPSLDTDEGIQANTIDEDIWLSPGRTVLATSREVWTDPDDHWPLGGFRIDEEYWQLNGLGVASLRTPVPPLLPAGDDGDRVEFVPAVAPPTINYQGDGKKRRKRRDRQRELFDQLEQTLRAELAGTAVLDAEIAPVAALSLPRIAQYRDELGALQQTLEVNDQLRTRLLALQAMLADYAARQVEQQLRDDEDDWMMMT
jgi:hypothetical protein